MNYTQALKSMLAGNSVRLGDHVYNIEEGTVVDEDGMALELTESIVDATTYALVVDEIVAELHAFFDTSKNRWVSTTNPEKHRLAGHRVGTFVLSES